MFAGHFVYQENLCIVMMHLQGRIQCGMVAKASVDGAIIRWLASIGLDKIRGRTLENEQKGRNFCDIEQLWLIENYLWGKDKAGGCSGATFVPLLLTCTVCRDVSSQVPQPTCSSRSKWVGEPD